MRNTFWHFVIFWPRGVCGDW